MKIELDFQKGVDLSTLESVIKLFNSQVPPCGCYKITSYTVTDCCTTKNV